MISLKLYDGSAVLAGGMTVDGLDADVQGRIDAHRESRFDRLVQEARNGLESWKWSCTSWFVDRIVGLDPSEDRRVAVSRILDEYYDFAWVVDEVFLSDDPAVGVDGCYADGGVETLQERVDDMCAAFEGMPPAPRLPAAVETPPRTTSPHIGRGPTRVRFSSLSIGDWFEEYVDGPSYEKTSETNCMRFTDHGIEERPWSEHDPIIKIETRSR